MRYNIDRTGGEAMLLRIDFQSDEAFYIQLCNQIILGIATSQFRNGDVLPSVRTLADEIGINMHTVNKAYNVLKQEGFVRANNRSGTVICVDADNLRARKKIKNALISLMARGFCHNISVDDMHSLIDEIADELECR